MMNNKLLSICIPTYNRAEMLKESLSAILKGAHRYQDRIEVIVSDNASTDNTSEVINELKKEFNYLKCFRNETNQGFNVNIFKLSDEYATGKYFWLIGDDDFLDSNAIDIIIEILEKNEFLSFLGLNYRVIQSNDIDSVKDTYPMHTCIQTRMSTLINMQCSPGNILASFISCNIMLLKKFKNFDKTIFSDNSWNDYKSLFPHSYIIASANDDDESVKYISEPLISVLHHEKEWDDRLPLLNLFFIIDVYKYFINCGYNKRDIRKVKKTIINGGLFALFKSRVGFKYKWNFLKFSLGDFFFYELLVTKALRKILNKI